MKYFKKIFILTLQCLWFIAIALPIMLYLERPPTTIGGKREILNPDRKVAPGGVLMLHITAPLSKYCPGEVVRIITDSTGREYPFAKEPRPNRDDYNVEVVIPLGVYPGKAEYWAKRYWQCNWVQKFFPREDEQDKLEFEIIPADGQMQLDGQQGIYMLPDDNSIEAATTGSGEIR